ncbi:uncharacterized protein EMH_0039850 [Eimeria mitis]|uniref:Uncharacterized protein n=1 Tax=Eimeria mitis TaxID=44415 RepID=U6KI20_9EIME|nr:uncharacterized protein EMH_0039850 [Eimeria mitis]CDJ35882.1 hypothetical protein EMH_0039850 [Eimeria mitis]
MRPLLPLVALVASGLQADALAPVEGDPPNLPVFPTGDAEGPSFYSHSPLPVSPHSKIHHRRSISALALIVPIVAVVFLIYQCILHLKRRDDPFITVQSRRLASGELDPCSAPEGDESGSDPAALPTGNGSPHGKQLGRLQLGPQDTACLTQEEVRGVGDARRLLQGLIKEIQSLEQQSSSLSSTAASLRASLAKPPEGGGPEAEQKKKELQKMLHKTSQGMDKVRAQLVEKKFHCNEKMWTAGQDSTALLRRASLLASGRHVTSGAAAALVARDIVLGTAPDIIFDGPLKTALGALVQQLLAEEGRCNVWVNRSPGPNYWSRRVAGGGTWKMHGRANESKTTNSG